MTRNLVDLESFATSSDFGVTGPLTRADVFHLAQVWLPQLRFHEDELFFPITLLNFLDQPGNFRTANNLSGSRWQQYFLDTSFPPDVTVPGPTATPLPMASMLSKSATQPQVSIETTWIRGM